MADQVAGAATLRFHAGEARASSTDPDSWLLERSRQGDLHAFEQLFRKYQTYVYNIGLGMLGNGDDASDITQETFLRIHRNLDRFRGDAAFSTWLYRVAVNLCITELRWRQRGHAPLAEDLRTAETEEPVIAEPEAPDVAIVREEDRRRVHRALRHLPPDYRAIMVLRHFQQLAYDEIARVLGLSLSQVKTRLFRARRMFKERYEALTGEGDGLQTD